MDPATALNDVDGEPTIKSTWVGSAGPAAFDFRSDTRTNPTPSMLKAIQSCSMLDDVFNEDPTTLDLEAHCAKLCGMEAGLLALSGTMGNQLGLRALLTRPPHGVLCDVRSHIVKYEAGGTAILSGAQLKPILPKNEMYMTLEDVQANAELDDDVHTCPTRIISLENTLSGMITPLEEVRKISKFARENGVKIHCDGSRLWEVAASGAGSLVDYAACFDTVTLCFSKGLGAPIGSILLGSNESIAAARWFRKAIGGGTRQSGVFAAPARVAVDEAFGSGPNGEGGLLRDTHELAKVVEKMWADLGGKLVHPVHTNMCVLDLESEGIGASTFDDIGRSEGLQFMGQRLVIHYQICQRKDEVLPRLERVFKKAMEQRGTATYGGASGPASQYRSQ